MPPFRTALVGRCGFPFGRRSYCLLEEGCHSAGFVTTIHLRHHLLLSIGWRFNLFAPEEYRKYVIFHFRCQWGEFDSYTTVTLSQTCKIMIPFESLRKPETIILEKICMEVHMKANPNRFWIIVILLGWAFDFLFWKKPLGINFAIFVILCLVTGVLLLRADGFRLARGSGLLLLPVAFFAAMIFTRLEPMTVFLSISMVLF